MRDQVTNGARRLGIVSRMGIIARRPNVCSALPQARHRLSRPSRFDQFRVLTARVDPVPRAALFAIHAWRGFPTGDMGGDSNAKVKPRATDRALVPAGGILANSHGMEGERP